MDAIIVTVTDEKGSFFLDMELPVEQSVESLTTDIVSTLNAYDHTFQIPEKGTYIFSNRTRRVLENEETLKNAGVWNGDFITLVSRRR